MNFIERVFLDEFVEYRDSVVRHGRCSHVVPLSRVQIQRRWSSACVVGCSIIRGIVQ